LGARTQAVPQGSVRLARSLLGGRSAGLAPPPDGPWKNLRRPAGGLPSWSARSAAGRTRFFSAILAAGQGTTPAEHWAGLRGDPSDDDPPARKAFSPSSGCVGWPASAAPATTAIGAPPRRARKRPRCAMPFNAWRWRARIMASAGSRRSCGARACGEPTARSRSANRRAPCVL
jgi:hypothetical protein